MEATIKVGQNFFVIPTDKFERNDIVVYDFYGVDYSSPPETIGNIKKKWVKVVFRMVAYSGDKIEIKDGNLFINDGLVPLPVSATVNYEIKSKAPIAEENSPMAVTNKIGDTLIYTAVLTIKETEDYKPGTKGIISIKRTTSGKSPQDYFGPLKIPGPGDTINVNDGNYLLYQNIPDIQHGNNVIKEKLYFVLGDNWYAAEDSRYIGLIPHSKMYGIVK